MCGISGVIFFKENKFFSLDNLKKMTDSISHRGPDSSGLWVSENKRVFLGHRRLSILDLSKAGNQPMTSSCTRYVITFNGEIYNFIELSKKLRSTFNLNLKNGTDTIVLLELISKYGLKSALKYVEGMFAFALWDRKDKKLFLVRDRFGEKPLFYHINQNYLIFGSELKSIKKFPSINLKICENASFRYSMLGYIPAPNSIFKNTYKVMPSQIVSISHEEKISKYAYYKIRQHNQYINIDYNKCKYRTKKILEESIKKMMIADVEIGCFLSGGIDSSLVALLMQKNSRKKIKTFNVGFNEKEYDESNFAKEVATKIGTEHYDIKVKVDDMINNLEDMVKIVDEPFSDSSIIPTFLVSKLASSKVKVVLSGDGGDEVFLGYNRYQLAHRVLTLANITPDSLRKFSSWVLKKVPANFYDKLSEPFQKKFGIHALSHKIYKLSNIMRFENNSDFYMKLNILDNDILNDNSLDKKNIFEKYENYNLVESIQRNDLDFYLPNDILVKVDRASMINSLEVRSPFLHHNVVNNSFQTPQEYKLRNKVTKFILKDILSDYMSASFVNRPKMGFAIPIEKWIKNKNFENIIESIFNESDWTQFGWDSKRIINKWQQYKKYQSQTPQGIWMYLIAGLWLRNN